MEVKHCPVCNKIPKIQCSAKGPGYLGIVTCGPLFGKPHMEVVVYEYYETSAMSSALNEWNRKVDKYENR